VNLRKAWGEDEMPSTIKIQYPLRNEPCREGRWARKVIILTQGRPVGNRRPVTTTEIF